MTHTPPKSKSALGLKTGLLILSAVSTLFLILALGGNLSRVTTHTPDQANAAPMIEDVLTDNLTRKYLRQLTRYAPAASQTLRIEAAAKIQTGATPEEIAALILRAALSQFREQALTLRYASTDDYDAILAHLRDGFREMVAAGTPWCQAETVEQLLKRSEADLVDQLLSDFPYNSKAYQWALDWSGMILQAADRATSQPVRRGPRTTQDKQVLQERGLALGSQEWTLALQIATFSQAEGQGYGEMRQVVSSIDICKLGIAAIDLSDSLPEPNRGRIWAELLPEIFYGNTPYVLSLVTDYFFLS